MCCDSWGHKESDTTERLNLTELTFTALMSEKMFGMISNFFFFFKFTKARFMAQDVIYPGEGFVCA